MGILVASYLVLVLVVVPLITRHTATSGLITSLPRATLYRASMATSWVLALLGGAVVALDGSLTATNVGLSGLPAGHLVAMAGGTLAALAAGILLIAGLRGILNRPESPDLLHLVPRTARERRLFWGVSVTAGITEEFVFRGIALTTLARIVPLDGPPGPWVAAAMVSVAFGLGHAYQGGLGMMRAGTLGYLLAVPVLLTGSLLPGMVAHTLIDLTLLTPMGRQMAGTRQDDGDDPDQPADG